MLSKTTKKQKRKVNAWQVLSICLALVMFFGSVLAFDTALALSSQRNSAMEWELPDEWSLFEEWDVSELHRNPATNLDELTSYEEMAFFDEVPFDEFLRTMEMYDPRPGRGIMAPIVILDYGIYATEEEAWEAQRRQIEDGSAIMHMSATPSITIVGITSTSVTLNLTFPQSGARGNALGILDFNHGETRWTIHQNNTNRINGNITISGLVPGGLYHFQLMWSTNGGASFGGYNSIFRRVLPPHNTTATFTRTISNRGRIITYIETADRNLATTANFNTWINRMETVYDALENLTGHAPRPQLTLRSMRTHPSWMVALLPDGQNFWFELLGWAWDHRYADHPMAIYRPFSRSLMLRLNNNDWGEVAIHEMSHNFSSWRWEFDSEFFAYLKTFYVADNVPGVRLYREDMDQWFTGRGYVNFFRNHEMWGYNSPAGFHAGDPNNFSIGLAAVFADIQDRIGWEPFRQTFRYFNSLPYSDIPQWPKDRFNLFVSMLNFYSGQDVWGMITDRNPRYLETIAFGLSPGGINPIGPVPEIYNPRRTPPIARAQFMANWAPARNATYRVTLENLSNGQTVFQNRDVGSSSSILIRREYLDHGNRFRLTVEQTLSNQRRSSRRTFYVEGTGEVLPIHVIISPAGPLRLTAGATQRLTADVRPLYATDRSVRWSTGNSRVADITPDGMNATITTLPHRFGITEIRATSNRGNRDAAVEVIVDIPRPAGGIVTRGSALDYWGMNIGWPLGQTAAPHLPNRNLNNISSPFGPRTDATISPHLGMDIAGLNAPVLAVTDGNVIYVSTRARPEGIMIVIRSTDPRHVDPVTRQPLIFMYKHLRDHPRLADGTLLVVDDTVNRGDRIGFVGSTGTGCHHLHFEISNFGRHPGPGINPDGYNDWRKDNIANRVNPRFFYGENAFSGWIRIWSELNWTVPPNPTN